MIPSDLLVIATALPLSKPHLRSGNALVERAVNSSTYILNIKGEHIAVELNDGSLQVGEKIHLAFSKDGITIGRIPDTPPSSQSQTAPVETYAPRAQLASADSRIVLENLTKHVQLESDHSSGISKALTTVLSALAPAITENDPALSGAVSDLLQKLAEIPADLQLDKELKAEILGVLRDLRQKTFDTAATQSQPTRIVLLGSEKSFREGLYQFDSPTDAAKALRYEHDQAAFNPAAVENVDNNQVTVRIVSYGSQSAAIFLEPGDVSQELRSWTRHFESRALQSFPPAVLEQILIDRSSLHLDTLQALDSILAGKGSALPTSRAGNVEAQEAALVQWLHTTLDAHVGLEAMAQRMPGTSVASMVSAVEELARALEKQHIPVQLIPQTAQLGLETVTEGLLPDTKSLALPLVFQSMGLAFESTLNATVQSAGNDQLALNADLKTMLLRLLGYLELPNGGNIIQQEAGQPSPQPADSATRAPEFVFTGFQATNMSSGHPAAQLENITQSIPAPSLSMQQTLLSDILSSAESRLSELVSKATELLNKLVTHQETTNPQAERPSEKSVFVTYGRDMSMTSAIDPTLTGHELKSLISKAFVYAQGQLGLLSQPPGFIPKEHAATEAGSGAQTSHAATSGPGDTLVQTSGHGGTPPPDTLSQVKARIDTLMRQLAIDLERTVGGAVKSLPDRPETWESQAGIRHNAGLQNANMTQTTWETLSRVLAEVTSQIDILRKEIAALPGDGQREPQSGKNPVANHTGPNDQNTNRAGAENPESMQGSTAGRDALKQPIEALLSRLESLQILARQVTTSSGEQQIIALPMKIGGEWNEVHVRFVKKQRGKSDKEQKNFSVYLNVAPSGTGPVTARMDYDRSKNLHLVMDFENRITREWFINHRVEIKRAFQEIGFPAPVIELRTVGKRRKKQDTQSAVTQSGKSSSDRRLDLKV